MRKILFSVMLLFGTIAVTNCYETMAAVVGPIEADTCTSSSQPCTNPAYTCPGSERCVPKGTNYCICIK